MYSERLAELRYNPYRDWKTGKYESAPVTKQLTGGKKRGKISTSENKMTKYEKDIVSSGILTDFPNLKRDGLVRCYEYGDFQYYFIVKGYGNYQFKGKLSIKGKVR